MSNYTQESVEERTRRAVIRALRNYPNITRSMLSVHLRPTYSLWSDALQALVESGEVVQETKIRENHRSAVTYRLADHVVDAPEDTPVATTSG